MAKEFYSLDEAADVLGVGTEEVRGMVTEGRVQGYDQDGEMVFKIEDIERIVANEGSSIVDLDIGAAGLEPKAEELELSVPEPTSDINLLGLDESSIDLDLGPSPTIDTKPAPKPAAKPKEPPPPAPEPLIAADLTGEGSSIALADSSELDIGLSASDVISLDDSSMKSSAPIAPPPKGKADSKTGSKAGSGISVFEEADIQGEADPAAKTQISPVAEEELQMASVGSGSGLLDLTRESDDTSLGAELLDVISPSEGSETETAAEPVESDTGTLEAEAVETVASDEYPAAEEAVEEEEAMPVAAAPAMAYAGEAVFDPMAPAFTGLAAVAMAALCIVGLAATSQIQGVWPGFMRLIDSGMNLYFYAGGIVLLAGVAWMVGWMVGKPSAPKKPKPPKPAKAPKVKKAKAKTKA